MPQTEFAQILMAGEKATITGPGIVEFKMLGAGALPTKAVGAINTVGAGGAAGKALITTTGAGAAQSVPASFFSGKVMGFSLASLNPWVLVALGVAGGYVIAKKRYPRLVW